MAPSLISWRAFSQPGVKRRWLEMINFVLLAWQALTMESDAFIPIAMGFSHMTALTSA